MQIAVVREAALDGVIGELSALGVEIGYLGESGAIPKGCELVWAPCRPGTASTVLFADASVPVVTTVPEDGGAPMRRQQAERLRDLFRKALPPALKNTPRLRKLEVTTTAGCRVDCSFCPHDVFAQNHLRVGGQRLMDWETFRTAKTTLVPFHSVLSSVKVK